MRTTRAAGAVLLALSLAACSSQQQGSAPQVIITDTGQEQTLKESVVYSLNGGNCKDIKVEKDEIEAQCPEGEVDAAIVSEERAMISVETPSGVKELGEAAVTAALFYYMSSSTFQDIAKQGRAGRWQLPRNFKKPTHRPPLDGMIDQPPKATPGAWRSTPVPKESSPSRWTHTPTPTPTSVKSTTPAVQNTKANTQPSVAATKATQPKVCGRRC